MLNIQLTKNPSITHHQLLQDVCAPLKRLGVNFFGYTAVDVDNNAFCLGSKADYALEYLRRNHARHDIHYSSKIAAKKYYYNFWDYLRMDSHTEELYRMAAAFDQGHTLTITQENEGLTHCFHFSGRMVDSGINQRYLDNMDSLHAFVNYFKDCLETIPELSAVYDYPIIMGTKRDQNKIESITSNPRHVNLQLVAHNTIYFKNLFHHCLNTKELECLKWLSMGKSAALIAEIKQVSYKTIERHIESCKRKYECYTLFQLGQKITDSGLTSFLNLTSNFQQ